MFWKPVSLRQKILTSLWLVCQEDTTDPVLVIFYILVTPTHSCFYDVSRWLVF